VLSCFRSFFTCFRSFVHAWFSCFHFFFCACFRSSVPWFVIAFVFPFLFSYFRSFVHAWFSCFRSFLRASVPSFLHGFRASVFLCLLSFFRSFLVHKYFRVPVHFFMRTFLFPFLFSCFLSFVHAGFSCFRSFLCNSVPSFMSSFRTSVFFRACFRSSVPWFMSSFVFPFLSFVRAFVPLCSLPPAFSLAARLALVLTICKTRRATHLQRTLLEARHNEGRQLLHKARLLIISKCVQLC